MHVALSDLTQHNSSKLISSLSFVPSFCFLFNTLNPKFILAMAAPNKLVIFMLFICLLLLNPHLTSGCNTGKGCLFADAASRNIIQSRKVLYVLGGKKVVFNMHVLNKENELVSKNLDKLEELRNVPAGPDPLHHNGSGPEKPKNSP